MFKQKFLSMVLSAGLLLGQAVPHAYASTYCDQAQFISDITVPDGASFAPGATFTKTWRFMNAGTCTWTTSYKLVYTGGDAMSSITSVNLPVDVAPGQMLDVSVNLTAPSITGHYKSLWKFANASGVQFGIGDSAAGAFWVDVNVIATDATIYDFVVNAPYAKWKSGAGILLYPGTSGDGRGFAYQVDRPHLEDDSYDTLPGLLTVPQNKFNGYIQATYPEFQVQQGDKLQTLVNCEFGATGCYVTFRIDYLLPNGLQNKLWQWKEAPDNRFYRANIDLSALAGQKIRFVFMLLATGPASGDRAIWGSPRIIRTGTIQPPAPPATLTPLPALTPTPTPITPPPPTIAPTGCDRATFVTDVNIPDGTVFAPGAAFSKTWRLKNSGSCTWTKSYKLTYYSGEVMNAQIAVPMPFLVYPGETVDVTVNMVAPGAPGNYRSYWILANASGTMFGIGSDASKPFWVDINVAGESPQETGYNFWSNVCAAQWKSGAGALPCPGTGGDRRGLVIADNFSHLEDGTMGPAPTLLLAPENKYNGYIQGYYPAFTVQPGDRFRSVIGCEYGANCYVTFRLDYMFPNGYIGNFWQGRETNDKKNNIVDVDLSPLAGKSVRFILTILATGTANSDLVRWGAPMIIRAGGSVPATTVPPTITPVPPTTTPVPPTLTPTSPPVVPVSMRSLHMIDVSNGWGITDQNVVRTYDGGTTWYNVMFESMPAGGYFASPDKAWVISNYADASVGSLYRTTNGGLNWTRFDVPFNSGYLQFVDDNTGYLFQITGAAMNKQSVILFKTTDGGATWTLQYNNDPTMPGSSNTLPLGGHKNAITFSNTTTGWIGGETPTDGYFYFYKTSDSGITWSRLQLAIPAGYESAYITTTAPKFFGANDAVLPVWMSTGIDMRDLFLYVTHNGGNTWTASPASARHAERTDIISMNNTISWDWSNLFHVTDNGGNSWTTVTPNIIFGDEFRQLDFVSPTTGWVRQQLSDGHAALYRTTDGGSTWTMLFGHYIPTPTPTPDPTAFVQSVVGALNTRNFMALPPLMDETFVFAYWQSQGTVYQSETAIEYLRTNNIAATLIPDPVKDLTTLLGGANPYTTMGLDPAKSQALFVSGWGLSGNEEAILFITQRADGNLYWHSVLIAPYGFATPTNLIGPYAVINVAANDVLNIRSGAGVSQPIIGWFASDAKDVMRTGPNASADEAVWVEVRRVDGLTGWVNSNYLTEYVTHEAFCADTRILPLIEQARQSMDQSNGSLLAPIVSPVHGVNMHLWAYGPGINFTQTGATNVYADTTVYNWGGGPSGIPDTGTFNAVVKPKYLEVLNAPDREIYCDDLTKVFPLSNPWPYPNIRFYNLYKPASDQVFDFRTLLVGIEYINGQPYIYGMVTIIWEP
ncbi:MAG TPA: NBR1-Ig-like domain-containing protein [Anaerolineales bacterium]|nr:NBR1-Ig-like domain-containing protein [Anaerolineales bacterium]